MVLLLFIKMASSQGYKFEFIDSVLEDFLCKKCNLVARRLTLTSCCGESFCQICIADTQEQGQPCPVCGEKEFSILTKTIVKRCFASYTLSTHKIQYFLANDTLHFHFSNIEVLK